MFNPQLFNMMLQFFFKTNFNQYIINIKNGQLGKYIYI